MNQIPTVSVIIPNYNHANYLRQRIESVLNQKFSDFEIILLDDCSSDNSRQILLSYQDNPKVAHIIFNDQNSGSTFKQWDKGLSFAKGTYIWIAESDDFAEPNFLSETIKALRNNAVLAFTGSRMVDEENKTSNTDWDHFRKTSSITTLYSGESFIRTNMIWTNRIYNASMVVFRKECYNKVNPLYKQFRYCGDWLFWAEICRQGNIARINRKLNYFRQHACKVSPKAEKEGLYFTEGCQVMQYLIHELHVSPYQQTVIGGRTLKRLLSKKDMNENQKQRIIQTYSFLSGNKFSIFVYEFDKLFNLSNLQP